MAFLVHESNKNHDHMDAHFTLDELSRFCRDEKKLAKEFGLNQETVSPKKSTIENILNFSKAYSNRPSKYLGRIEFVIN
jgi:hypothetical protein